MLKPAGQSRSHSISMVPLQISLAHFFVFGLPSKLRVVHIRKKFKIFLFSKMAHTISSNFVGLLNIRTPTIWHYRIFPEKSLYQKTILIFYPSPNVALTPTDQSCSNSIFMVLLQLSPTHPFHFGPSLNIKGTLMLRVVHNKNQETEWKTWNFKNMINYFVAMLLN